MMTRIVQQTKKWLKFAALMAADRAERRWVVVLGGTAADTSTRDPNGGLS